MGIKNDIVNAEIDFLEPTDSGESVVLEVVGDEKNGQETVKIEVSSAIFIYRKYIEGPLSITVDVIPFHQIKSCTVSLGGPERLVVGLQ